MRIESIIIIIALITNVAELQAQSICEINDSSVQQPRLWRNEDTIFYKFRYSSEWSRCVQNKKSYFKLEVTSPRQRKPLMVIKQSFDARLQRGQGDISIQMPIAQICKNRPYKRNDLIESTDSLSNDHLAYWPSLSVRLRGTRAAKRLDVTTPSITIPCPKCQLNINPSVKIFDEGKHYRLKASVSRRWYKCVQPYSSLDLLVFTDETMRSVLNAIRPTHSIFGLEQSTKFVGNRAIIEATIKKSDLCENEAFFLGFEFWGRGSLKNLGQSNRIIQNLNCAWTTE